MATDPDWAAQLAGRRIVVTGAHGAIGGHLILRLTAAAAHVLCLDLTDTNALTRRPPKGDGSLLPVTEDTPLAPISPYGLSKAAATQYLDWFATHHHLPVTTLILGNVYGTGTPNAVIDRFIAAAAAGTPTILHGNGTATRDFIHIDDVTDAFLAACVAPPAGRVNIGSGTETSIRHLHTLIADLTPHVLPTQRRPARPGDIPRMRIDTTRAATLLGWHARTELAAGITTLTRSAQRDAFERTSSLERQ